MIKFLALLNVGFISPQKLDYSDPFKNEIYFPDVRSKITQENLAKYFEYVLLKEGNTIKISSYAVLHEKDEGTQSTYNMIVDYSNVYEYYIHPFKVSIII